MSVAGDMDQIAKIDLKAEMACFDELAKLMSASRTPGLPVAELDEITRAAEAVEGDLGALRDGRRAALAALGLAPEALREGLTQLQPTTAAAQLDGQMADWQAAAAAAAREVEMTDEFFRIAGGAIMGVLNALSGRDQSSDIYGKHGVQTTDGRARWLSTVT